MRIETAEGMKKLAACTNSAKNMENLLGDSNTKRDSGCDVVVGTRNVSLVAAQVEPCQLASRTLVDVLQF